jgi:hypothetical protein
MNLEAAMDLGQWIVIGLSVLFGGWYAAGYYFNRHRGEQVHDWLRSGLKQWGRLGATQQRGSLAQGARLEVTQASAPFKRIEAAYLLEARENLPLWAFNHLQGKRDEIIVKARMRSVPRMEIVAAPSGDRDIKRFLAGDQIHTYEQIPAPQGFVLLQRGQTNQEFNTRLGDFLEHYQGTSPRIVIQTEEPHLVLRAYLSPLLIIPAEEYFQAVGQLMSG